MEINCVESYSNLIYDEAASSCALELSLPSPVIEDDLWAFQYFWPEVQEKFTSIENLYAALEDIQDEIRVVKEKFRGIAEEYPCSRIVPNSNCGVSSSYLIESEEGVPLFIVKPIDEDGGCIHNAQGYATPFMMSPFRTDIPLYKSSLREVLAYRVANEIGCNGIVPKTTLSIIESATFHDLSLQVAPIEMNRYREMCGSADYEKLCSVQEYVSNSKDLFEAIHEFEAAGFTDDEIAAHFDQDDFENANILLWTTYDTDGHFGNFLVYPKGVDAIGNEILGIKKIDNGLAFPDSNQQLRNNLSYLPNANKPLSDEAKNRIARIDVERLAKEFETFGLETAIPALRQRVALLQKTVLESNITIKEINRILSRIERK